MDMDNIRSRRTGKIRQRIPSLAVVLVVSLGLLTACGAWTRPDDNQIRAAIQEYHEAAAVALELDYATMKVPQWFARMAVSEIIVDTMKRLKLEYPQMTDEELVKLDEYRSRLLHEDSE